MSSRPGRGSAAAALGLVGRLGEALDDLGELLDALVDLAVLARRVARVDALEDDRQLPVAEGDEEVELGEVAAGALRVAGLQLLAGREARRQVRRLAERRSPRRRARASRPSAGRRRRAGRRACRAPSRRPPRPRRSARGSCCRAGSRRGRSSPGPARGCARARRSWTVVDRRQLARLRLLPLAVPAAQLAGDVVLLAAEVAEPDRVGVDGVDRDQGVDDALADRPPVAPRRGRPRPRPGRAGSAPRRTPSRRRARR